MHRAVQQLTLFVACVFSASQPVAGQVGVFSTTPKQSLTEARQGFTTKIVREEEQPGPPDTPTRGEFRLVHYRSPVGKLAAYVTVDPRDGNKHPAIVWITGGDCNSIGDVWSRRPRDNEQSARAFREQGIVMMFPSLRGGNGNPGRREGFLGEVDDILAATDHLAKLPYVDASRIYLGGHSTGGTMVMLVAATSDRYQAVFALGPVAAAMQYGGELVYCDPQNEKEMSLRSPINWLHGVKSPLYVMEGERSDNWQAAEFMAARNRNAKIRFLKVPGHDHFSVIAPLTELLAKRIRENDLTLTVEDLRDLR